MQINLQPAVSTCSNFVDASRVLQCKTVVIVPLIVKNLRSDEENRITLIWACNLADECLHLQCLYSRIKHHNPMVKGVDQLCR